MARRAPTTLLRVGIAGAAAVALAAGAVGHHRVPSAQATGDLSYVAVQPLMDYVGADEPVVPSTAVVDRGGRDVVYVVPLVSYPAGDSVTTRLIVRATPVAVDRAYGRAVSVSSGLTPCSVVVVDPPQTLDDGDRIRSYESKDAEGPSSVGAALFAGRLPAAASPVGGGIAYEEAGSVRLAIDYRGPRPEAAAAYVYTSPTGETQRLPFAADVEVGVPRRELRRGQPVGHVEVVSRSGRPLADGPLQWYC